ncbi:alpha-amylase family glycosyl hydrolase [Ruania alba]|uniref:Cyclomaltodextrinase n=1 Tax=Ruania alba TaxID=648782 RepID=A0A1H5KKM5_9MICO|nr:alpha-amylase family glycosyl hydrolase [Ruania alba]SEE65174.1 cyclomaltodextrinase [Ruania alba]
MSSAEHTIWWHVYPLGFVGADTSGADRTPTRRLPHLIDWLDHLLELGANGLALGPIFDSSTHGYDTIDFFRIDPRLGTEEDLIELIEAAHTKGIDVMLDGVFNHVGPDFPALRTARENAAAPEARLFEQGPDGELVAFEGHGGLITLNHAAPEVADLVTEVMTYWCDRGVDAWRLDAAYTVPIDFWNTVLPAVRERHPQVYVMGEVLHGDYVAFVRDGGMDAVTQYELWQGIWHSIADHNFHELDHALGRHNTFLDAFVPYTFVGNHDVTRIASQVDDDRHLPHALAPLFTLGGTPSVYYGDEFGLRAVKEERFGGDDAIRPAFPGAPAEVHGADPDVLSLHQELIGLRRRHPWLHTARSRTIAVGNDSITVEVSGPEEALIVSLNIGDEEVRTAEPVPGEFLAGRDAGLDGAELVVGAHGWAVARRS